MKNAIRFKRTCPMKIWGGNMDEPNNWRVRVDFPHGALEFELYFIYSGEGTVDMALRQLYKGVYPMATTVQAWPI